MKKSIALLLVLLFSTACFADIILQQDYEGIGLYTRIVKNPNAQNTALQCFNHYTEYGGLSGSVLWEFNSASSSDIHYMAGIDVGAEEIGFQASLVAGLSRRIATFSPFCLELTALTEAGPSIGISNGIEPYFQTSANLTFMSEKRKGAFLSVGFSDQTIIWDFYKEQKGMNIFISNSLCARFAVGLKF